MKKASAPGARTSAAEPLVSQAAMLASSVAKSYPPCSQSRMTKSNPAVASEPTTS